MKGKNTANTISTSDTPSTSTTGSITVNPPTTYGWVCPKCGRVNAPWKATCDCYLGEAVPNTPPKTPSPFAPFYGPYVPNMPDYNPPAEPLNPFDPYGPYKWGDAPGWWQWGPTCRGGGLGSPIPCDANFHLDQESSHTISTGKPDPNIKIWSAAGVSTPYKYEDIKLGE